MRNPWVRGSVGLLLAELVPILLLVLGVAIFGPKDAVAAASYAQQLGRWVGPIAGAVCVLALGWWVARARPSHQIRTGFVFGCLAATLDLGILAASDAPFELLFAISNLGRVLAGTVGGFLAARSATTA